MNKANKKNVILIATDGLRADRLKYFENIVKLSKSGSFFPHVVTYAPYSIASFHAIFTGIYGNRNGVDNYYGSFSFKDSECKTLTSYLHENDYYTMADVMNNIVVPKQGFDEFTAADPNGDILPKHRELIKKSGKLKKEGRNFFLFLHCDYLHNSLIRDVVKVFDDFSEEYFNSKEKNTRRYDDYIKKADKYLEIIFEDFKQENIDDSIILIFSDHGCSLGERVGEKVYGSFCYDYTIMTFGIFLNNHIFASKEFTNLIRTVDFMPTILDFLGISLNETSMKLDGKSLRGILSGAEKDARIGFCETGGLGGPNPSPNTPNVHCVRSQNWKLIFNKSTLTYELYDLKTDPAELNNLYDKKEVIDVQSALLKELRRNIIKVKEWRKQK